MSVTYTETVTWGNLPRLQIDVKEKMKFLRRVNDIRWDHSKKYLFGQLAWPGSLGHARSMSQCGRIHILVDLNHLVVRIGLGSDEGLGPWNGTAAKAMLGLRGIDEIECDL